MHGQPGRKKGPRRKKTCGEKEAEINVYPSLT
jgi:hypothetical protein